jgi:hypothetical protein
MLNKSSRAARILDNAVESLESATAVAGTKVKRGIDRAAEAVAGSETAERIVAKVGAAKKATAKKATGTKKGSCDAVVGA